MTKHTTDVAIAAGEILRPVWRPGVFPEGQGNMAFQMARAAGGVDPMFRNFGTVEYVSDQPNVELILLWVDYSSSFWFGAVWENRGDLIVRASAGEARGFWAFSWGPDLINAGRLIVEGQVYAIAFQSWDGRDPVLRNSGEIAARAQGETYGVIFGNRALVENAGAISAVNASPIYNAVAVQLLRGGVLENTGEIRAESSLSAMRPRAVELHPGGGSAVVWNAGTIIGRDAVYENPTGAGVTDLTNAHGGRIVGDVRLGDAGDRVVNDGRIEGEVDLGLGDDRYVAALGSNAGGVFGGDGHDTLTGGAFGHYLRGGGGDDQVTGGAAFDDLHGNMGRDTVSGGAGGDWVVGGQDADSLFGDAGNDIVYGNLGADTCAGGDGNDTVRGGQQDDVLTGGAGDDYMSGDRDSDTITGGAGADIFHTFGDAGMDRVLDFSLAEGDRVQVDPGTTYTVSQVGADTVIDMTGGGQMVLVGVPMSSLTGAWIIGA